MDEISIFIFEKIREVKNGLSIEITNDTLFEDLTLDSISFIRLIISIEVEYQIEFDDDMLLSEKYEKVGDLVRCIHDMYNASTNS